MFTDAQEQLLAALGQAGHDLATATAHEMRLEEQRPLLKADAIQRLIQHGAASSATAAEKIVEKDAEYAAHRELQVQAAVGRIRARAAYDVALAKLRLAAPAEAV